MDQKRKKKSQGENRNALLKMKSLWYWKGFNTLNWYIFGLGAVLGFIFGYLW